MTEFITPRGFRVDPAAVTWTAVRPGGPGGQHANTSDTAVTVQVDLEASGLPEPIRERVINALGAIVSARSADTRSQWRNRQLAWERIASRIDTAATPRARRRASRPSRGAVEERLGDKRRRAEVKRSRQPPRIDE